MIGVDDEQFGQRLKAFVVARRGAGLSEDDVKGYVKENLARYKVPREVVFLDELPRNATGRCSSASWSNTLTRRGRFRPARRRSRVSACVG